VRWKSVRWGWTALREGREGREGLRGEIRRLRREE